ncbi:arabinose isomerase [Aestuariimicrobium soli]|uniref:arabinose isomerase n=1 Tax=Aestuariimicrobium soli TaxID=2035834 RepID=UPI003EB8B1A9
MSVERAHRKTRIGLVAGGLGAYWPQFPELLPTLQRGAARITERFRALDAEVVDVGFISDAVEARRAGERLRTADVDLLVFNVATYLTSSMVLPVVQRAGAPVLVVDLQPTTRMDHDRVDTGGWLAYCGQCSVPEIGNLFRRAGIDFDSVSGHLDSERAWARIDRWVRAAGVRARLREGRHGLMGHVYPGMLDVATDSTLVSTQLGGHVETLEYDDLRVRVDAVTEAQTDERVAEARRVFELDSSVNPDDLAWGARVSVGLDRLVEDFDLDSLAYYHRGLDGEVHERLAAGMILGASLLTARGVPAAGEYELRTSLAMVAAEALGSSGQGSSGGVAPAADDRVGGSFTEIQALNFDDGVVEMGHDGPGHLALSSGRPVLRGLGIYHGKRGYGVSVEFDVRPGPVTTFGIGQDRDGTLTFIASEGEVVPGPLMRIGNTTSRVDFGMDPGDWVDCWSATGIGHHWALCPGHRAREFAVAARLLGRPFRQVTPESARSLL